MAKVLRKQEGASLTSMLALGMSSLGPLPTSWLLLSPRWLHRPASPALALALVLALVLPADNTAKMYSNSSFQCQSYCNSLMDKFL